MAGRDGSAGPKPDAPAGAAASFRYPPAPAAARTPREETVLLAQHPPLGEDDDEPTRARNFELGDEPTNRRVGSAAKREETARLDPEKLHGGPSGRSPSAPAAELRPSDSGWGTVVLPGGGHPAHVEDRTQLLAVDVPADEVSAAISVTTMIAVPLGVPERVELVSTASLTGMGGPRLPEPPTSGSTPALRRTEPPTSGSSLALRRTEPPSASGAPPAPAVASATASRGPADEPGGWTIPRVGPPVALAPPPSATYPVISGAHPVISGAHPVISGAHPVISGPYPVVGPTPMGGVPVVPRSGPRGKGRQGAAKPAPTGAHPSLRATGDDTTRMAWGFLVGVLITVAILGGAVGLSLFLLR
jgi:hypothetical protein